MVLCETGEMLIQLLHALAVGLAGNFLDLFLLLHMIVSVIAIRINTYDQSNVRASCGALHVVVGLASCRS